MAVYHNGEVQLDDEKAFHIKCTLSVVRKCPIALYRRKMSQNIAIWLVAISTRRTNSRVWITHHVKWLLERLRINKNIHRVMFTNRNDLTKSLGVHSEALKNVTSGWFARLTKKKTEPYDQINASAIYIHVYFRRVRGKARNSLR